jgi:hypothetical protein
MSDDIRKFGAFDSPVLTPDRFFAVGKSMAREVQDEDWVKACGMLVELDYLYWERGDNKDRPYPGKFEGNVSRRISEVLYDIVMESGHDDELDFGGDNGYVNWYGLILAFEGKHYIVHENNQGSFTYEEFETEEDVIGVWEKLRADLEEMYVDLD